MSEIFEQWVIRGVVGAHDLRLGLGNSSWTTKERIYSRSMRWDRVKLGGMYSLPTVVVGVFPAFESA